MGAKTVVETWWGHRIHEEEFVKPGSTHSLIRIDGELVGLIVRMSKHEWRAVHHPMLGPRAEGIYRDKVAALSSIVRRHNVTLWKVMRGPVPHVALHAVEHRYLEATG